MSRAILGILSAIVILSGCGQLGDSEDVQEWRLSGDPVVTIGVVDGEASYQLHRVVGVAVPANGGFIVADAGSGEVRRYDVSGRHVWSAGGQGDGPGEFQQLASVDLLPGDSILLFDAGQQRVSVLDPEGAFARSWTLESQGRGTFPSHAMSLQDGSVVVFHFRGHMPGDPSGLFRPSAPALWYTSDGEPLGEIADVPGDEWYRWEGDGGAVLMNLPFGKRGHAAAHGSRLYVGSAEAFEFHAHHPDRELVDTIRLPREPAPVGNEDIQRYEANRLEALTDPDDRARQRRIHADIAYPEFQPAYASLVIDAFGNLWIEEYVPPPGEASRWSVVDSAGGLVTEIVMPEAFDPMQITDDLVIGVFRDALDVEYIHAYELTK